MGVQVEASRLDTALDFSGLPKWVETCGVGVGCIVAVLLAAWAIHWVHSARMNRDIRWRMRRQLAEQERSAYELHDTLLQGVQGLTWRIQTIANAMPIDDPDRARLEHALDIAEELLRESRSGVARR